MNTGHLNPNVFVSSARNMEDPIDTQIDLLVNDDKNITGVLIADKQGLCIKTTGNAREEASGIITAITNMVSKLEPNKPAPEVILESDTKSCLIYCGKNTNAAVFKNLTH